jgi:nucleoside-diphosphate kinase
MEKTLVFLKPDAVRRRLVGEIVSRFERKGFCILGLKLMHLDEKTVREHYAAHVGKAFYEPLVQYVISGPIVAMVLEGKDAVGVVRRMMGQTFGCDSPAGTIRGDLALSNRFNLVHGSDSAEAAEAEMARFFRPEELVEWPQETMRWLYDFSGPEPV